MGMGFDLQWRHRGDPDPLNGGKALTGSAHRPELTPRAPSYDHANVAATTHELVLATAALSGIDLHLRGGICRARGSDVETSRRQQIIPSRTGCDIISKELQND